jgi:hypothetical protein
MTSYPYGQQQYYPTPPPAPLRPGSVTALAIIGIVFGGGGLLCKPFSLLALFMPQPTPNPAVEMQKEMMGWSLFNAGLGTLISALLLAAAIGALMLKPWARKGMLAYAGLAVLMNVVGLVVSLVWIVPRTQKMYTQLQQQGAALPPGFSSFMQKAGVPITLVSFVLLMVFPLLVGYFFSRAEVKGAFEGPGFTPAGGNPGQYAPPGALPPRQQ